MKLMSNGFDSYSAGQYAEESGISQSVKGYSSDLELGFEGAGEGRLPHPNLVLMHFGNMFVPASASITSARLVFDTDEVEDEPMPVTLRISAQLVPDAAPIQCDVGTPCHSQICDAGCPDGMVSSMLSVNQGEGGRTGTSVIWRPRDWARVHKIEKSPDISAIIQELIDQVDTRGLPTWQAGNSFNVMVEPVIDSGETGRRVAEAGTVGGTPPKLELSWAFHTTETRMALHSDFGEEMTPACSAQCADPRPTLDSSDIELPFDTQGCPGNNPNDPTPGDFLCEQVSAIRFENIEIPEVRIHLH